MLSKIPPQSKSPHLEALTLYDQLSRGLLCRIYTFWGTVLYYDAADNELRHGPTESSPKNVVFLTCGSYDNRADCGLFIHYSDDIAEATICDLHASTILPGVVTVPEDANGIILGFSVISRDQITLRGNGHYLCAESDGRVTLSKPWQKEWETFSVARLSRGDAARTVPLLHKFQSFLRYGREFCDLINPRIAISAPRHKARAIICDIRWLKSYIATEHYHLIKLLHEEHGFDIIDAWSTDFLNDITINELNRYELIMVSYQGRKHIPLNLISAYKICRIDDLDHYESEYHSLLRFLVTHSDMVVSPYAYELPKFYPHDNIKWLPYSSALLEECSGLEFNQDPIPKLLVSGSTAWDRPFRQYVFDLDDPRIDKIGHPGYGNQYDEKSSEIVKARWYRELHKYLCAFCDGHSLRYIHLRVFEVASVGTLLLADKLVEREMNQLGFLDGVTCIFCDQGDFSEKLNWILDSCNREAVDAIRLRGMELCRSMHMTSHRAKDLVAIIQSDAKFAPWYKFDGAT